MKDRIKEDFRAIYEIARTTITQSRLDSILEENSCVEYSEYCGQDTDSRIVQLVLVNGDRVTVYVNDNQMLLSEFAFKYFINKDANIFKERLIFLDKVADNVNAVYGIAVTADKILSQYLFTLYGVTVTVTRMTIDKSNFIKGLITAKEIGANTICSLDVKYFD